MRTSLFYTLSIFTALVVAGCTPVIMDTMTHGIFRRGDINFIDKNNAAADYLIGQARTYIDRHAMIRAEPLADRQHPGMVSSLSKSIPEQIGTRLAQLGYRVGLDAVASTPDPNYRRPAGDVNARPAFILSGTLSHERTEVKVASRITDASSGQIVAAFDYTLPLTSQVDDLAQPQPQIIRMTP
ncbi:MAG: hypothetical protein IT559_08475 [Alphaproteobacteria bacterium]|nr:hypothetical protein [Alphaproteobacteria bacterium]